MHNNQLQSIKENGECVLCGIFTEPRVWSTLIIQVGRGEAGYAARVVVYRKVEVTSQALGED